MPIEQLQALVVALIEPDVTRSDVTRCDVTRPEVVELGEIGDTTEEFDMEPTVYMIRPRVSTVDLLIAALNKP